MVATLIGKRFPKGGNMKTKVTKILTTSFITSLLTAQLAAAQDGSKSTGGKQNEANDPAKAEKNSCKGGKEKNQCQAKKPVPTGTVTPKKADKNSCKNGCGNADTKK
jgi:general stress protein YciG